MSVQTTASLPYGLAVNRFQIINYTSNFSRLSILHNIIQFEYYLCKQWAMRICACTKIHMANVHHWGTMCASRYLMSTRCNRSANSSTVSCTTKWKRVWKWIILCKYVDYSKTMWNLLFEIVPRQSYKLEFFIEIWITRVRYL